MEEHGIQDVNDVHLNVHNQLYLDVVGWRKETILGLGSEIGELILPETTIWFFGEYQWHPDNGVGADKASPYRNEIRSFSIL